MVRDLGVAAVVLAILIVILAYGGCGGPDLIVGSALPPSVIPTGGACKPANASCAGPLECCSQLCNAALCSCLSRGSTCTFSNTCCSGLCNITPGISQNTCT
jgi:hypothetical protein